MTDEAVPPKRQRIEYPEQGNGLEVTAEGDQDVLASAVAIQEDVLRLDQEESREICEINRRYRERRKVLYEQRSKVLAGIEGFWITVLEHSAIREYVSDYDRLILEYLTSLDVHEDDNASFTISLTFKSNPFFTNKVLTRTNTRMNEEQTSVSCSPIAWKDGQDLQALVSEDDGLPLIQMYLFMNWFITEGTYDDNSEQGGDAIAHIIKTDIWEHAIQLYEAEYEAEEMEEGEEGEGHVEGAEAEGEEDDGDEDDGDEGFEDDGGSDEEEAPVEDDEDEDEQDAL